jgi:hypothetical protein
VTRGAEYLDVRVSRRESLGRLWAYKAEKEAAYAPHPGKPGRNKAAARRPSTPLRTSRTPHEWVRFGPFTRGLSGRS